MAMTSDDEILLLTVIIILIVILFISFFLFWILRCRQRRRRQHKNGEETSPRQRSTPFTARKVHEMKEKPPTKHQQHVDSAEISMSVTSKDSKMKQTPADQEIHNNNSNLFDTSKSFGMSRRNKNLDSVSVTAAANETFPRNDSKNNVFPIEKIEEMDLNPGLNSPLNLETI